MIYALTGCIQSLIKRERGVGGRGGHILIFRVRLHGSALMVWAAQELRRLARAPHASLDHFRQDQVRILYTLSYILSLYANPLPRQRRHHVGAGPNRSCAASWRWLWRRRRTQRLRLRRRVSLGP